MSLDLEILEILVKCKFPTSSYSNFIGIARPNLRRLSLEDLKFLLKSCLPPTPTRSSLVAKFISNLSSYQKSQNPEQPIHHIPNNCEINQEIYSVIPASPPSRFPGDEGVGNTGNNLVPDEQMDIQEEQENYQVHSEIDEPELADYDSDVVIVDEVMNVAIIRVLDAETKKRILQPLVTIEDDEDETTPNPPLLISEDDQSAMVNNRNTEITDSPEPSTTTSVTLNPAKIMKKSSFRLGRSAIECIGKACSQRWTMNEFDDLVSPFQSTYVKELSIVTNCDVDNISLSALYQDVSLPNLTLLKINQGGKDRNAINYSFQLRLILSISPVLCRIEVCYNDETSLKTLLHILGSIQTLSSLSSLLIRHKDKLEALQNSVLTALGQISAPNLKELHLACCIRADGDGKKTKAAFQNMLQRFPILTKLEIEGCFVTVTKPWPKIVLDFPNLVNLQVLDLASSCRYLSTFETLEELPNKKKRKTFAVNLDPEQTQTGRISPSGEGSEEESIPVSINFSGVMPNLKRISFGVLYELQTIYFSEFPILKVFRVCSGWTQSYTDFSPASKNSRQGLPQTSQVERLQFPDSFQDCFIIKRILPHFLLLTHIGLKFPTVKFLRAFAKTMATTGPDSFKYLEIRTQFEFASSLDSCVLDDIVKPSQIEVEQLKILKAYPHWEAYVKENSIELPQEDGEDENPNKFCGLRILFKKLKWLYLLHIPRTLRIPKGPRHWIDDPQPEFTNTLIGFKDYPFSKAVEAECPPTMKLITWSFDMSQVSKDFNFEPFHYESGPIVLLEPSATSVKKEVQLEKSPVPSK